MSEGVFDSPQEPAVRLFRRSDFRGAQGDGPLDHGARILDDEQQSHRAAAERLGAEVLVRRRLV